MSKIIEENFIPLKKFAFIFKKLAMVCIEYRFISNDCITN